VLRVNELLSVLKSEVFSAKLPLRVNELLRVLKIEFFSARLELRVSVAVRVEKQFSLPFESILQLIEGFV
jgi:hypothetical protein